MKLQTKLILSFSLVALITLAVAAIGYWQAHKLAAALYEVGAVRLPSIQGLDAVNEGLTAIQAAEHRLLVPDLDEATVQELTAQEHRAQVRVDRGWKLYEPLPQTPEESVKWHAFVPAWRAWQTQHNTVMSLALAYRFRPDAAFLARAREQSRVADRLARDAAGLLADISAINDAVASAAKRDSVGSRQDMDTIELIMLATAALGVVGAIGLGVLIGRRVSRPMEQMSAGFAAVARGDLNVHISAGSNDEIGEAGRAMNSMIGALRDARNTLQVISDNLPNCMIYQLVREPDDTRRFLYVSAGVERLHGVSAAAVLRDSSPLFDGIVPEDREIFAAAQRASLASMAVFNVVVRVRRADGEVRWRQLCSQPQQLADGRIQLNGIELDITDRKLAEESLRESESRFRLLVSNSTVGLLMFSTGGVKIEVNSALTRILGYSREELLQINFVAEATHPEDQAAARDHLARLLAGEIESYEMEKRYRRKDGQVIWANLYVSAMRDTRDRTSYYVAQVQDINARKLAEISLQAAAEQLKLALQASRLGVWRREAGADHVEWDARMHEIFAQDPAGPAPALSAFDDLVVAEDLARVVAAREDLYAGRGSFDVQFRVRRPDGEIRHIRTQAVIRRDDHGRPAAIVGVAADLTELTHAMEESGRLREKLRQAQKMETLGTLAAGIAHDFNNLLTGINGFVDLGVASLPPDHEAVEMLKQARLGATSARDLVRRILNFSRRVPDAERSPISLIDFVRSTAGLITAGLPGQVSLSLALEDGVPGVKADASQLQQVLMNLCVNGAHAIGDRGGTITIGLTTRVVADTTASDAAAPPSGRYACLSVADTGCGMGPEVRARIFEPFYTTKIPGEGTGLGLSVVQDVVTDHGGFIRVQSEAGRGTVFEILLPACNATEMTAVAAPVAPAIRGKGQRILVVDDEPAITAVAWRALTAAGYAPTVFNSALEAWAHFAATPGGVDLLLLDHQMPDLSGVEFAGRAREVSTDLPVVVMTGQVNDLDPAMLRRLGRVAVLTKPFVIEDLVRATAAALQGSPATVAAVAPIL